MSCQNNSPTRYLVVVLAFFDQKKAHLLAIRITGQPAVCY